MLSWQIDVIYKLIASFKIYRVTVLKEIRKSATHSKCTTFHTPKRTSPESNFVFRKVYNFTKPNEGTRRTADLGLE